MLAKLSTIVIDENKVARKNLSSLLRNSLGIKEVNTFDNGNFAQHYLKNTKKLDLAFIDYETVSNSTFEIIEKIKQHVETPDAKFILISKQSNKEFLLKAAAKGVSSFILKPYNSATIVKNVNALFASKSQRKASRLKLLEAVPATMKFDGNDFEGSLIDISSGGCQIKTKGFQKKGVEIFDKGIIEIPFDNDSIAMPMELIRLERDRASEERDILAALIFSKIDKDNGLKFAQFWASLLKHGSSQ